MTVIRSTLPPLPRLMLDLPIDERGYPVPFFVAWFKGVPDFRVADRRKMALCMDKKLCWICGKPLGIYPSLVAFTIGPMCAINRISSEPPQHTVCSEYAVKACPFLVMPKMHRREDRMPAEAIPPIGTTNSQESGIVHIDRNPGVILVWLTRGWTILRTRDGPIFRVGRPQKVMWYCEGRAASRDDVMASITSGMPLLRKQAEEQENPDTAVAELLISYGRALRLVPT